MAFNKLHLKSPGLGLALYDYIKTWFLVWERGNVFSLAKSASVILRLKRVATLERLALPGFCLYSVEGNSCIQWSNGVTVWTIQKEPFGWQCSPTKDPVTQTLYLQDRISQWQHSECYQACSSNMHDGLARLYAEMEKTWFLYVRIVSDVFLRMFCWWRPQNIWKS